jgi:chromosome transmission fidelity protein 1
LIEEYDSDQELAEKRRNDQLEANQGPKIIYASRTHSQISQFVKEIEKTIYSDARVVTLGSRKNLCVNEAINGLALQRLNDECLDRVGSVEKKCHFRSSDANTELDMMTNFSHHLHAKISDIEDTAKLGKDLGICPYYSARHAVADAEIVCLPYNLLLQDSTRKACGINLSNSIVIVDEAHNLIDSINSMHSIQVPETKVKCL